MMRAKIPVLWGSFVIAVTCFVLAGDKPDLSPVMLVEWERNDVAAADTITALTNASTDSEKLAVALKEGNARLGQFGPILTAESVHIADLLTKPHSTEETKALDDKSDSVTSTNGGVSEMIALDSALIAAIGAIKFEDRINEMIRFRNNLWERLHPTRKPVDEIVISPLGVKDLGKAPDSPTATGVIDLLKQNVKLFGDLENPLSAKQAAIAFSYDTTLSKLANSLNVYFEALKAEKTKLEAMLPHDQTPADPDLIRKLFLVGLITSGIENERDHAVAAEKARTTDVDAIALMLYSVAISIQNFKDDAEMLKKKK